MDEYESLSHTKYECIYHVVFIPKGPPLFQRGARGDLRWQEAAGIEQSPSFPL